MLFLSTECSDLVRRRPVTTCSSFTDLLIRFHRTGGTRLPMFPWTIRLLSSNPPPRPVLQLVCRRTQSGPSGNAHRAKQPQEPTKQWNAYKAPSPARCPTAMASSLVPYQAKFIPFGVTWAFSPNPTISPFDTLRENCLSSVAGSPYAFPLWSVTKFQG